MAEEQLFVSYASVDTEFVDRLRVALEARGRRIWVDRENLRPSQRFWEKIEGAIDQAVAFLAVLSPDSVASAQCAREIGRALDNKQRIVPILWRDVDWNGPRVTDAANQIRSSVQMARFAAPVEFDAALDVLVRTLDDEWEDAEKSAELRALAIRWESGGKSDGSTLNADQLARLQTWVTGAIGRTFEITDLQREFLQASHDKAARDRQALEDALESSRRHERAALGRESLLLASQSRQQTAAGRPDLGAKLAMLALPRRLQDPDRPLVTAAESALFAAVAQHRFRLTIEGGADQKLVAAGISPDGRRAFVCYGALGEQTQLWDLDAGEPMTTFGDQTYSFRCATFSPDGRRLAIGYEHGLGTIYGPDGQPKGNLVQVVDAVTGGLETRFQVNGRADTYLRFSPGGRLLLVVTDQMLMLVETDTWEGLAALDELRSVTLACFSADENRVAMASGDGVMVMDLQLATIRVLALPAESPVMALQLPGPTGEHLIVGTGSTVYRFDSRNLSVHDELPMRAPAPLLAVTAGADQGVVAVTDDGRVHSWADATERIDFEPGDVPGGALRRAALGGEASMALVELADGAVEAWDLRAGARVALLPSGERTVTWAGFDGDGGVALVATSDGAARVWDRSMPAPGGRRLSDAARKASAIAARPGNGQVAVGYEDGRIELRTVADAAPVWAVDAAHQEAVLGVAFHPTNDLVVTASADGSAAVWSLDGPEPRQRLVGHTGRVSFAGFSPDGTTILTASSDSTSRLWDAATGRCRHVLALPQQFRDPIHNASINHHGAFTSDGGVVVTASAGDGMMVHQPALVWDAGSGELLHALHHGGAVWHVSVTPDDRYAVTASYDRTVVLWDLRSGERSRVFSGHTGAVSKAFVYDEGRLLVSASSDGTGRIWRVDSASVVHELVGHERAVVELAVTTDGRFVATGGADGTVRIWDGAIGNLVDEITGLDEALRDLAFCREPHGVVTRTKRGTVQAWSLPPLGQGLLDQAWARYGREGELLNREQRVRFNLEEA